MEKKVEKQIQGMMENFLKGETVRSYRSGTLKDARKEQELLKQRPELLKQQEDSQKK